MYNTLISSILNEPELIDNSTVGEDPELSYEHIRYDEEDYPYHENENIFMMEENGTSTVAGYLSPKLNAKQTASNKGYVQKSGLALSDIVTALEKTIDLTAIRQNILEHNRNKPGDQYDADVSGNTVDAVFTETIHQFQMANYLDPREHDGVMGQSTLETLGFFNHKLKAQLSGSGLWGQGVLNSNKALISGGTNSEFTSSNWFHYIVKPAFLGVKIHDGVHLVLLRKLREAEKWLFDQPQYKGLTPAALGKALGFSATTRYSGARLSSENQAMHGFGLAIDIHGTGNPWIGAGWIRYDKELLKERKLMIVALRNASGDKTLTHPTVFAYLHSIAQLAGNDTEKTYRILKQRNDEFITYLKNNPSELAYWKKSQSFGGRDPLKGFLNLNEDLVCALRQVAGLAWGAVDFGPGASGDIMHFDYRTVGFGKTLCKNIGGFVPSTGHPAVDSELFDSEYEMEYELHEAIGEAEWKDEEIEEE